MEKTIIKIQKDKCLKCGGIKVAVSKIFDKADKYITKKDYTILPGGKII